MKLVRSYQKRERTITMSTLFLFFRVASSCHWQIVQTAYGETRSRFFLTPKTNAFVTRFADIRCWSFFRFHDFCAFFHHKSIYINNFSFILPIAVSNFNSYLNKYFNCALLKRYCVHRAFQSLYYVYRRNDRNKSGPVSHVSRPTKH